MFQRHPDGVGCLRRDKFVASSVQMDAVAGSDGAGFPFAFWYEDGEGPDSGFGNDDDGNFLGSNDYTTRGPEASGRQYYSHSTLLRIGEYASGNSTAVASSTWGNIKNSVR